MPDPDDNPYAAPKTDFTLRLTEQPGGAIGPVEPFSIGGVMDRTWRLFQKRFGICAVLVLGMMGTSLGLSLAGNLLIFILHQRNPDPRVDFVAQTSFIVIVYAFQFWLIPGQTLALLKLAQDRDASFHDLFSGGRFFWRYAGALLLLVLLLIPVGLFCGVLIVVGTAASMGAENVALKLLGPTVGVVAAVVLAVLVMIRFYSFPYVMVDRDCGPVEALTGSYEITRGHVGSLFALALFSGMIFVSGALTCCVGLVVTAPLSMLIMSCTYVCLTDRGVLRAGPGPTPPPPVEPDFIDFIH